MTFKIPKAFENEYQCIETKDMKGWIDNRFFDQLPAELRHRPAYLLQLPNVQIVRDVRNLTANVHIGERPGSSVVWVKLLRGQSPLTWLRYLTRPGKATHAWNAAMALRLSNIKTPRPLVGLESPGLFGRSQGMMVFEDVPDALPLSHFIKNDNLSTESREQILRALGVFLNCFHHAGFCHRDLRSGNVLVQVQPNAEYSFYLIDLNRMRRYKRLNMTQRLRDLERLPLRDDDYNVFFGAYFDNDVESERIAACFRKKILRIRRLSVLPYPLNRLAGKIWYYWREIRGFRRQSEMLPLA